MADNTKKILFWGALIVFLLWLFKRKQAEKTTTKTDTGTSPGTNTGTNPGTQEPINPGTDPGTVSPDPATPGTEKTTPPTFRKVAFQPKITQFPDKLPGVAKIEISGGLNEKVLICVIRDQNERILFDSTLKMAYQPSKSIYNIDLNTPDGTNKITVYLTQSYLDDSYEHVIKSFDIVISKSTNDEEIKVEEKNYSPVKISRDQGTIYSPGTVAVNLTGGENFERVVLTIKNGQTSIAQRQLFPPFAKQSVAVPENCSSFSVIATTYFKDAIPSQATFFAVEPLAVVKPDPTELPERPDNSTLEPKEPGKTLPPDLVKPGTGTQTPGASTPTPPPSPRDPSPTYNAPAPTVQTPTVQTPTVQTPGTSPSGYTTGGSGGGTADAYTRDLEFTKPKIDPTSKTIG